VQVPYKTAPVNASPAPVVSISSDGEIFSAVPKYNLPHTDPIPSALNFVTGWEGSAERSIQVDLYMNMMQPDIV